MQKIGIILLTICAVSATAAPEPQTKLSTYERPTDANLQKAITTLYKAVNTTSEAKKDKYTADARKLLTARKVSHTFPGAVYVNGVKQFEKGEDSAYDFDNTCFQGRVADAANLINLALEQGLWSGDEEKVIGAEAQGAKINLSVHDGPNDENINVDISECR